MIRPRIDRCFLRYRQNGDPQLLARVFDRAAPELWRVAAHLCRDRHDAEDAVQSTFLTAIESKDTWDAERPLLPWLVGMLVNRVREQRRQRVRVVDAARLPARDAVDPATTVGERELGAAFAQALRDVTEPFRSVVEQHLVHGRSAGEIAAALGVPAATVRTRLHRGIEQLRRRLPTGAALAATVPMRMPAEAFAATRRAVLAKVPGGTGVAAAAGGGAWFAWLATKPAVLAIAAVALGLVVWWPNASRSSPRGGATETARASIAANAAGEADLAPVAGSAEAAATSTATREAVPATNAAGTLSVLVRNGATKVPLANVQVRLTHVQPHAPAHVHKATDAAHDLAPAAASSSLADVPTSADGVTDAEGRVLLRLAAGRARIAVTSGLPESRPVTVLPDATTEYVHDVPPVFTADVLVVDANGAPVADATISTYGGREAVRSVGRTDAEGRWRDPRTEDSLMIRATRSGHRASTAAHVSSTSGPVVLTLGDNPGSLHGQVLDADGAPVPHAIVVFVADAASGRSELPVTVRADEHGLYRCDWLEPGKQHILVDDRRDPDTRARRVMMTQANAAAEDAPPTDLRFPEGATLAVQLWRHNGDPVCNHSVGIAPRTAEAPVAFAPYLHLSGITDANGTFVLRGVPPGRYVLTASLYYATVQRELELRVGERARFEHTFEALTTLTVDVVDEHDQPRAGVRVGLHKDATEQIQLTTDAKGRVRFELLARGEHQVTLAPEGRPLAQAHHTVSTDGPNRLVLPGDETLGGIIGRLRMAQGDLPKSLSVQLARGAAKNPFRADQANVPFDAATGQFECKGLAAGSYMLAVVSMDPFTLLAQRPIEVAAPGVTDLGTIELGNGELHVEVRAKNGDPGPVHLSVTAPGLDLFGGEPPAARTTTPPLTRKLPPGNYRVMVWGPDIVPSFADATIAIGAITSLTLDVEPGARTEVRLPGSIGVITLHRPDGSVLRETVFELRSWVRGLAPGDYRVEYTTFAGDLATAAFTVTTKPGAVIELQLASPR